MKEERLYIVGYMASGKTTFGRALAHEIGWNFIDLDEEIEKREGLSVSEIMARYGEAYFRKAEAAALKATAVLSQTVIACGGGTPCQRDNMEFMTLHGMTLWLVASPKRIAERISQAGNTRPLVAGRTGDELVDFVKTHLLSRQPYYCRALWRFSGEHLENENEISSSVRKFRTEFLPFAKK